MKLLKKLGGLIKDKNEKPAILAPKQDEKEFQAVEEFDDELTKVFKPVTWDTIRLYNIGNEKEFTANLIYHDDNNQKVMYKLRTGRVNIGRMPSNELCIADNKISRLHAFILSESGKHVLYDGKSLNGTYVNDCRVEKHVLNEGDVIKVGNTFITYMPEE